MQNDLERFATQNDNFVAFDTNGQATGIYRGFKFSEDPFNKNLMRPEYLIEGKDGKTKPLGSGSKRLARAMIPVQIGDLIRITRSGKLFATTFIVEILTPATPEIPTPTSEPLPEQPPF